VELVLIRRALADEAGGHGLLCGIAIGLQVPHQADAQAMRPEMRGEVARGLRLAAAGAGGADRDDRPPGGQCGPARPGQHEIGAARERDRAKPHHMRPGHVAVGEDDGVHALAQQLG
jgi:hypothetical protein